MDIQSDQPIYAQAEDRLNRNRFATSVAKRIVSYAASDGLVLGLAGPWGSGKSSLLNLVQEVLCAAEHSPLVVRFTPWRYDDDAALLINFFGLLARTLKKSSKSKGAKKAANLLQRTGDVLTLGKPLDLVLPGLGTALAGAGKVAESAARSLDERAKALGTLDALHDELNIVLRDEKQRIVVFIDELDRLEPLEIRSVFRLVKTLADFPYITYVLAYDKTVIHRAIDSDAGVAARYLEKIVTIPLDLPPAEQSAIDNFVLGELLATFKHQLPRYYDEERFFKTYSAGFRPFFKTLRDVRRFLNVFTFTYGELHDDVDVSDLAALAALQVFEPLVYDAIRTTPGTFIDTVETIWRGDSKQPQANKDRISEAVAGVTHRRIVEDVLRQIFPKVECAYRGYRYEISDNDGRRKKRLSASEAINRFFQLTVGDDQVSGAECAELRALALTTPTEFVDRLVSSGKEKARYVLNGLLDDDLHAIDVTSRVLLISALFTLSDRLPDDVVALPALMPFDWLVGHVVDHVLEDLALEAWCETLASAINTTNGVGSAVAHIDRIRRLRSGQQIPLIARLSDEHFARLTSAAAGAVERCLRTDRLRDDPVIGRTVSALRELGQDKLVAEMLEKIGESPELLVRLVGSARVIGGFSGYLQPKRLRFDKEALGRLMDPAELRAKLQVAGTDPSVSGDPQLVRIVTDYLASDAGGTESRGPKSVAPLKGKAD